MKIAMIVACHLSLELLTSVSVDLGPTLTLHLEGIGWHEIMTPSYTANGCEC